MNNNSLHPLTLEFMEILKDAKPAGALRWERRLEDATADFENIINGKGTFSRSITLTLEKNFGTEATIRLIDFAIENDYSPGNKGRKVLKFDISFNAPATIRDTADFVSQIKTMQEALELGCLLRSTLSNRKIA